MYRPLPDARAGPRPFELFSHTEPQGLLGALPHCGLGPE